MGQIRKTAGRMRRECRECPERFFPPPPVSDMYHGTSVSQVPRSLFSGFLRSRLRVKRSQHSRCMRNPQFYVSGKRPMPWSHSQTGITMTIRVLVRVYVGKLSQHGAFKCPGVASSALKMKLLCQLSRLISPPLWWISKHWWSYFHHWDQVTHEKHISIKQWEAITHQWSNFHGSLGKLSLEYNMAQQ